MTREEQVRADLEADGWRAEPLADGRQGVAYIHPHKQGRILLMGGDEVELSARAVVSVMRQAGLAPRRW